jgi:hypothetical protein
MSEYEFEKLDTQNFEFLYLTLVYRKIECCEERKPEMCFLRRRGG